MRRLVVLDVVWRRVVLLDVPYGHGLLRVVVRLRELRLRLVWLRVFLRVRVFLRLRILRLRELRILRLRELRILRPRELRMLRKLWMLRRVRVRELRMLRRVRRNFDACGGHVFLADRGYHYHSASSCVLAAMDVGGLDELLVGWALDGFGLYAVLDAAGALSDPMHDLDECRGAAVLGEYRYYVTASLPHAPPCLRGAFEAPTRAVASPLIVLAGLVCGLRAACLLADPYWTDEAWSALTYGGLWGVCYPMMDVVLLLELWHACEITAAVSPQVFAGVPAPLMLLLGSASRASAVGDFGIQFMADYLRSRGNGWEWLKICQIYYVVLGLLTDSAYFLLTTQQRLFEVLLCVAVVYAALPTHWALGGASRTRDDEKDENRESNLSFSSAIIGDVTAQFTPSGAASKLDLECDEEADYRASMDWRDGAAVRAPAELAAVAAAEVLGASGVAEDAAAYAVELEAAATAESPASPLDRGDRGRRREPRQEAPDGGLLDDALRVVRLMEALPMRVMDLADFAAFGKIPRSSDGLARDRRDGDYVVFVSHRWWGPTTPDADFHGSDGRDATRVKYGLIKRGIEAIVRKEKLDRSRVCVWMDFACIEQDDAKTQKLGVQSLIAWASRVDVLLVPVKPALADCEAFDAADAPAGLRNYGERAWCRLECYVFLCLAEMAGVRLKCFGYGASARGCPGGGARGETRTATSPLRHLRVLDLSFCRFRALDATLLAEAVVGADELRVATLKLAGAPSAAASPALARSAGLDARKSLARGGAGDGEVAGLHHDCALRHLDVAANGFGLAGTRALARSAAAAKHLLVGLVERSVTIDVGLEGNADVSSAVRHEINLQHALVKYSRNRAMGLSIETPSSRAGASRPARRFSPRHAARSLSGAPTRAKRRLHGHYSYLSAGSVIADLAAKTARAAAVS
ncbi:hypothetical protein JL722_9928 [Aureococcus anophagefferens]|nr:hypothetical protein JL722_9928 [Aureococcus anophagefferens]